MIVSVLMLHKHSMYTATCVALNAITLYTVSCMLAQQEHVPAYLYQIYLVHYVFLMESVLYYHHVVLLYLILITLV
jgi:hypothetical protein